MAVLFKDYPTLQMNMAILSNLTPYLKSLKEKWNLWAMALESSSGPVNNVPMECGLVSTKRFLIPNGTITLTSYTSEPNTIMIHMTWAPLQYQEMSFNITIQI